MQWFCTTNSERWIDKGNPPSIDKTEKAEIYINVNQEIGYQKLDENAWGGCFNERGWQAMEALDDRQRTNILEALFGKEGLRLNVARTPIAASDYAIHHYSYNETKNDYEMKHFSIEQDEQYLIPYIRKALEIKPDLKLWASPWTPPSWVKKNHSLIGGDINDTPENLKAYALYFAKYIQAYQEKGIHIYMVMPQNEPTMNTAYASCVWSGEQLNTFIKTYLAPTLREQNITADIWLGTFTDSDSTRVDPILQDEDTMKIIKGVAFQWWGKQKASAIYRRNTGLKLMQSETMCGDGQNNWQYAEDQFDLMKGYFESGVNSYMLWNMVLNETGANTAANPWFQNAPITVHSKTREVCFNPHYYLFKHFSYFIEPGARRIKTEANRIHCIAFQNADGRNILVVKNGDSEDKAVTISFNGKTIKPTIPGHSVNTFTTEGKVTATKDSIYSEIDNNEIKLVNVKFIQASSQRALSVENASIDNGTDLILYDNKGTQEQIWTLEKTENGNFKIINSNSLRLIGISGGSTEEGANALQWDDDGSDNQQWKLEKISPDGKDYYKILNYGSQKVLSTENQRTENNTKINQQTYTGDKSQLWEIIFISGQDSLIS